MPTKNRRELSGRQRTFVSLWVGLGFLIVGLYQAITHTVIRQAISALRHCFGPSSASLQR